MSAEIRFVYFDLGNVILKFDNDLIYPQLANVADVPVEVVRDFLQSHNHPIPLALELGEITFDEVFEQFCHATGKYPDKCRAERAVSDIFTINAPIVPIVSRLSAANVRLGILSNTSDVHWRYITDGRFGLLPNYFDVLALSFQIGCMKPDERIYDVAADLAGVPPESIFFTDDRPENVEGARRSGFDAVQFRGALELAKALNQRGIRFNY